MNDTESGFGYWKFSENDYNNRSSFMGSFKGGIRNGVGTFFWKSGEIYIGDFVNDLMELY